MSPAGIVMFLINVLVAIISSFALEDWEKFSPQELEHQMSPMRWNPNKSEDQVVNEYLNISIRETQEARRNLKCVLSVPYGNKPTQLLDIYGSDLPADAPIFMWIHGGYWQVGSKDISGLLARSVVSKGVRNVVFGYTLAPTATIEDMEVETVLAVYQVMKDYPNAKIILGGHSAGAQLAAMLLHRLDKKFPDIYKQLAGLALASGVYDLRPLVPTFWNKPLKLTSESAKVSSPLHSKTVNPDIAKKSEKFPILLMYANYDSPEFQKQTQKYFQLLTPTFPNTELWKSPNDDHFSLPLSLGNETTPAGQKLSAFLETFVKSGQNSVSSRLLKLEMVTSALLPLLIFGM